MKTKKWILKNRNFHKNNRILYEIFTWEEDILLVIDKSGAGEQNKNLIMAIFPRTDGSLDKGYYSFSARGKVIKNLSVLKDLYQINELESNWILMQVPLGF